MKFFSGSGIAAELKRRNVERLLHSTHLYRNLPQILADGSLHTVRSLRDLHGSAAARYLHDPRRYEKFAVGLDYLNASLSEPNAPLLYHRSKTEWQDQWVHLALDPALLARADTLFCPVSAAEDFGKHLQPGLSGLQGLFADEVEGCTRVDLLPHQPTHPQAEVLIKGPLPLEAIRAILVPNGAVAIEVERLCSQHQRIVKVEAAPQLFVWPKRLLKKG